MHRRHVPVCFFRYRLQSSRTSSQTPVSRCLGRCLVWLTAVTILSASGLLTRPSRVCAEEKSNKPSYEYTRDIQPLLRKHCVRCHREDNLQGDLNLNQAKGLLVGGRSGPAIRIGAAELSVLYDRITAVEPHAEGASLTVAERGVIRTWINHGAQGVGRADSGLEEDSNDAVKTWAFQPPMRPAIPVVKEAHRVRNPIDAFVLNQLEDQGLTLAADAPLAVQLRRVTFDLLGLPAESLSVPSSHSQDPNRAYLTHIDQLLANPHYGERWGRHWLDVAGYADSAGILNEDRSLPLAWRYRDYVVRSFNLDKPYDVFLREQLAGDELSGYWQAHAEQDALTPKVVESLIATGFLRTAPDPSRPDFSTIKNADALYFYPTIDTTIQIATTATMGLTMQCARCHNHKFDPISQADYYRLQSIFMAAFRPAQWVPQMERRLKLATQSQKQQAAQRKTEVDQAVKGLRDEQAALKSKFADKLLEDRLAELPEVLRDDVRQALATQPKQRNEVQIYLNKKFASHLKPDSKTLDKLLPQTFPAYASGLQSLKNQIQSQESRRIRFDEVRALYDLAGPVKSPLLLRGDPRTPGPLMQPGVPAAIRTPVAFQWDPVKDAAPTSGRRLALARWLTQPGHPLTARVMVNRIWQHHFGVGLVPTPGDFGAAGAQATHPELLDWLACEFVEHNWSIKHIQRLIVASSTYRQSSRVPESVGVVAERADPGNTLLWRQRMRRLEAEAFRDAILSVAGQLQVTMYGAPTGMHRKSNGEVVTANGQSGTRRSIYLQVMRLTPLTMLELFDQPVMESNCLQRMESTVSLQALTLMNSDSMAESAAAFAERILRERPEDPVSRAVELAFSRAVTDGEKQLFNAFLEQQSARYGTADPKTQARHRAIADLCHMLLSANEFAYID